MVMALNTRQLRDRTSTRFGSFLERKLPFIDGLLLLRFRSIMKSDDLESVRLIQKSDRHIRYAIRILGMADITDKEKSEVLFYLSCSQKAIEQHPELIQIAINDINNPYYWVRSAAFSLLSKATLSPHAAVASKALAIPLFSDNVMLRNDAAFAFKTAGEIGGDFTSAFPNISKALALPLPPQQKVATSIYEVGLNGLKSSQHIDSMHYFLLWALSEASRHGYDISFLNEHKDRLLGHWDVNIKRYVKSALNLPAKDGTPDSTVSLP